MGQRSLNCIPEAAEEEASGPTVDHTLSVYLINDFNLTKAQEPGSATSVETPREAGSQDLRWLHSSGIKFLKIKVRGWVNVPHHLCRDQKTSLAVSPHLPPCLDRVSCYHFSCQTSWPTSVQGFSCLSPRNSEIAHATGSGLTGPWDANSSPHTSTASTFPLSHLPNSPVPTLV